MLHGGSIVSCDRAGRRAEALAIRDGRVAALGGLDEARAAAGPEARLIDIEGATVLPGLVDTHPHLMHFGVLAQPLVDLSDAADHEDIVGADRGARRRDAGGEWIMTTPVGEPHYFLRRSWRDLAEGGSRTERARPRRPEHPV